VPSFMTITGASCFLLKCMWFGVLRPYLMCCNAHDTRIRRGARCFFGDCPFIVDDCRCCQLSSVGEGNWVQAIGVPSGTRMVSSGYQKYMTIFNGAWSRRPVTLYLITSYTNMDSRATLHRPNPKSPLTRWTCSARRFLSSLNSARPKSMILAFAGSPLH
jgi:hypothetical protein